MIAIRADANEQIGTGHVMRCLSVADALLSFGEKVLFITADHRGDELIISRGFETVCLDSDWTKMDDELEALKELINESHPTKLLVDSYYVTESYFKAMSPIIDIAYFDDMNACRWDVGHLINYNIFANSLDYSEYSETNTEMLLGPTYAPLRKEFKCVTPHLISEQITDVLVSAGGADPAGITELLMERVCSKMPHINFHFVVGALNPRIDSIKQLETENVLLHINETHISQLMRKCDVAISAAGTTLYELCACGIPTITFTLADNQLIAASEFEKQEVMINSGDSRDNPIFPERVTACLKELAEDMHKRREYSEKMQNLVDGHGAETIARRLLKKEK